MWPFKRKEAAPELEERVENAERHLRGLKSDLEDLWDRFTRLQGRIAKRGELASDTGMRRGPVNGAEPTPDESTATEDARRAHVNEMILARRRGRAV